jgi:DNA-binding XRE family transcriptional regulator
LIDEEPLQSGKNFSSLITKIKNEREVSMAKVNTELKLARMNCGMNQRELAQELGIGENLISAWETKRATPLPDMRYRIAKVLNSTPELLFKDCY